MIFFSGPRHSRTCRGGIGPGVFQPQGIVPIFQIDRIHRISHNDWQQSGIFETRGFPVGIHAMGENTLGLIDLIKGAGRKAGEPLTVISQLSRSKTPVKVEIERTSAHFYSRVLLRSGAVVLSYPQNLERYIKVNGWVRLRPSGETRQELRLQISSVRFGGSGPMAVGVGQMSLLCKIPNATYEPSKRDTERFNTRQFKDLLLELRGHPAPYPILNLSSGGVRIRIPEEHPGDLFVSGATTAEGGVIHLGKKSRIELVKAVTRHVEKGMVGLEIRIDPGGQERKILDVFLDLLRAEERKAADPR